MSARIRTASVAAIAALALAALVGACGGDESDTSTTSDTAATASSATVGLPDEAREALDAIGERGFAGVAAAIASVEGAVPAQPGGGAARWEAIAGSIRGLQQALATLPDPSGGDSGEIASLLAEAQGDALSAADAARSGDVDSVAEEWRQIRDALEEARQLADRAAE